MSGGGLVRETRPGERRRQKVSRAVAGEHPACTVRSMRGGSKPDDGQARLVVTETGRGPPPIRLVRVRFSFRLRDLFAPRHEPRAGPANGYRSEERRVGKE